LLKKYKKEVPQTWDELIETAEYILEQENDDSLVGYNGYFPSNNYNNNINDFIINQ